MKANELPVEAQGARRAYRSPRRAAAALATRAAVLEAARRLFVERGYAGTTLAAVAAKAEVSLATVKLVAPTKAALLLEVAFAGARGDMAAESLAERPEWSDLLAAPTPAALLAAWAALASRIHERQAAILEVVWQAASADADVAAVARQGSEARRAAFRKLVEELERRGALRVGLAPEEALDIAWAVNSPELFRLFARRGWTRDRWEAWLLATLRAQLLGG